MVDEQMSATTRTARINEKKILILVLAFDREPWRGIQERGQRQTWAVDDIELSTRVLWLHGLNSGLVRFAFRSTMKALTTMRFKHEARTFQRAFGAWAAKRPVTQVRDQVRTRVPETYISTNAKTIAGLRFLLHEEFDFVLRTNSSTYINKRMLATYVSSIDEAEYYGGRTASSAGGDEFASGACILLSRAAIERMVDDEDWEYDLIDDVAIGRSMKSLGIGLRHFARPDVLNGEQLARLGQEQLSSVFAVRCKSVGDREHDITAIKRVHALYQQLGLS